MIELNQLDGVSDGELRKMPLDELSALKNHAIYHGTREQASRIGRIMDERLPRREQYGGPGLQFWRYRTADDDGCDESGVLD
jgi:hypothetical protein